MTQVSGAANSTVDVAKWEESRLRIFLDSHTPDWQDPYQRELPILGDQHVLTGIDPGRVMSQIADSGADSVILFAKCQYGNSYHPTEIGWQHSDLAGRDYFGESLEAAHTLGMKVIAYFSNMWDTHAAGKHPEWRLENLPTRPNTGRWPTLCLASGYREYALAQVKEIAQKYPIDGLWSDILTPGPCACAVCRQRFRDETGFDMPTGPQDPGWIELIRSNNDFLSQYLVDQRLALDTARPGIALIPNFYGTTYVNAISGLKMAHIDQADVGSTEGYTDWHGLGFPSYAAKYIKAAAHERSAEVLISRFVHTWDFTLRSEAQMRYEAFTVAAHGATVTVDDQPYASGKLEPQVYERLGNVFAEIRRREWSLSQATPYRFAALYVSQRSRELESLLGDAENPSTGEQSAQFPPSQRRNSLSDLDAAITGTYRALVENHIPVDLLDDRPESLARMGDYQVIILPDVLDFSDGEVAALTDFVRSGGNIVATGPTGIYDNGTVGSNSQISDLLGVDFGPLTDYTYPYINAAGPLADTSSVLLPHYGPVHLLAPNREGVTILATRTEPILETAPNVYWHNNQPAPGRDTDEPIIVESRVGDARIITSAARLGNNHGRLGHEGYRNLIGKLVIRAAGAVPVRIRGSHRNTELVLTEKPGQLIAHLVTGFPLRQMDIYGVRQPAAIEDVASIARIDLEVPATVVRAQRVDQQGQSHDIPITADNADATYRLVQLTDVSDWETVILQLE